MSRADLFGPIPSRKRRVLMHVTDAGHFPDGKAAAQFACPKCCSETGWIYASVAEAKRGIPCSKCNEAAA